MRLPRESVWNEEEDLGSSLKESINSRAERIGSAKETEMEQPENRSSPGRVLCPTDQAGREASSVSVPGICVR